MKLARDAKDAFAGIEPQERQRLARLGSVLFMAGSLTAVPAGLLLDPPPEPYKHLISLFGFLSGALLYRVDWMRLPAWWLHVFPIAGALIVIAGVTVFSVAFSVFIVLACMFVAISVRESSVLSVYMAFFVFALFLPLTYSSGDRSGEAMLILAILPVMFAVALVSRYMHDVVERQKEQYRLFASEAIALGERIRGSADRRHEDSVAAMEERLHDLRLASSRDRRNWSNRPQIWPPSSN